MCGRYVLKLGTSSQIAKQVLKQELKDFKEGDVYPGDKCLCIIRKNDGITLKILKWGLNDTKLINARLESINQKITFKNLNKCIILASGYYEWKDKIRYEFDLNGDYLYLAGLYDDNNEMVIITKEADDKLKDIHDRMPVVLNQKEMLEYLLLNKINYSLKDLNITS